MGYGQELNYHLSLLKHTGPHANIFAWFDACDKLLEPRWVAGKPISSEIIRQMTELRREFNIDAEDQQTVHRLQCEFTAAWYAKQTGVSMTEAARKLLVFARESLTVDDNVRDVWELYLPAYCVPGDEAR